MCDIQAFSSGNEKELMDRFNMPDEVLPYPLKTMDSKMFGTVTYYDIPKCDKGKILKLMYPFWPIPKMNEYYIDIHEDARFKVSDYMLIRDMDKNYLVSPFYPNSGGMAVDWLEIPRAKAFDKRNLSLEYGKETIASDYDSILEVYHMPDDDRVALLRDVLAEYGDFGDDAMFYDCRAQRCFKWQDFLIDADDHGKGLASPFFDKSGSLYGNCTPVQDAFNNAETLAVDNCEARRKILPYSLSIVADEARNEYFCMPFEMFKYDIPEKEMADVLASLFPFRPVPALDSVVTDAFIEDSFRFKDCIVTRKHSQNVLLTPLFNDIGAISLS